MNGGWFWHGNKPRSLWIALRRDLHDRYTNTRGLTNLHWVCEPDSSVHLVIAPTTSGTPIDYYYPGDDAVNVVGHNCYDNDWVLPFDSDAVWRGHGKIFAVPQAGSDTLREGSRDNLVYLNGVTNSIPRLAFFCAWNTFVTAGGTVTNVNAIADNPHPVELTTHPLIVTRDEVNWRCELPSAMSLDWLTAQQLRIKWQDGVLQHTADLVRWFDVPNAAQPHLHDTTSAAQRFGRLRR